jgi:GNAT superfamily N-acetyltransferase
MKLPEGYTARAPVPEDAQRITDLICACDVAEFGEPDFAVQDLETEWRRKGFELTRDAWTLVAPDGSLVAYGDVHKRGDHVLASPNSNVHPDHAGKGLEEALVAHAEEWTRHHVGARPIPLRWIVNADNLAKTGRLERLKFRVIRHDLVMRIDMQAPPPAPLVPEGITLRPFEQGRDERAVHAVVQTAFRDMWGHTRDHPYDEWASWLMEHPDWTPELSYLAEAGAEIVGATMVFDFFNGGWIRQLAVLKPWRRRGIGIALLYTIFGAFYVRGVRRVGLAVDSENLTGATRLYKRAGMRVETHYARYEKLIE